ncbi:MAG: TlpA family protein disulfide reductase [Sedimentisphaerales bacterium]|nr:TlpA family protein disulfide reductase [Sedimentisphaerales bacterium]
MAPKGNQRGLGLGITALALGIAGLLSSVFVIGSIFALAGVIIAIIHLANRFPHRGFSISGFVLSLIAILASAGFFMLYAGKNLEGFGAAFPAYKGKPAPDMTLKTIDGEEIKLSNLKGKRVLLDFWATWCPPCRRTIPHLIELRKTTSANDLVIIGISDESPNTIRKFRQTMKVNYPLATVGRDTYLPKPFSDVSSIPTFFIIDANGVIENARIGGMSFEQFKKFAFGPSTAE